MLGDLGFFFFALGHEVADGFGNAIRFGALLIIKGSHAPKLRIGPEEGVDDRTVKTFSEDRMLHSIRFASD